MFSVEDYQDRILTCRDCGKDFTFTAGEQAFYASKGLTNTPGRCPDCRATRRSQSGNARPPREQYEAVCASCGNPTTLPFVPRDDRPVYCTDCYQSQRSARPPRREESQNRSYGGGGGGGGGNFNGGGGRRERNNDRRSSRW